MIEDSSADAKLNAAALRRAGHQLEFERIDTADGMRAALATSTWDVITCDWAMPNFSAPAALLVLKESGLDIPFIIVSGTVGEELAIDAVRAGAHDYVIKDRIARLAPAVEREVRDMKARAEQRLAAATLTAIEDRYRRIVETTNQGVWVIDAEGHTTFLNERMAELLGTTVDDGLGRSPVEFLDEQGRTYFLRAVELHRARLPLQDEVRLIRADGSSVWVLLESSPTFDAAGQHAGAFAMAMDITARKQAEASTRTCSSSSHSRIVSVPRCGCAPAAASAAQVVGVNVSV